MEAQPLEGDVQGYYICALKAQRFYEGAFREPLFIWTCKLSLYLFGASPPILRWQSLFLGLVLIALTYWVGRCAVSPLVGLGAAFLVSINGFMIINSCRGLRLEFYMNLVMLYIYFLFQSRLKLNYRLIISAVIAALMALTRISSLSILVLFYGYFFLSQSGKFLTKERLYLALKISACLFVVTLAVFPFLYNCNQKFKDPFYSVNQAAKFLRNHEFADRPGFMTRQERARNPYGGEPITTAEYIFGLHSFPEVCRRYINGYLSAFLMYIPNGMQLYSVISYLGLIGLIGLLLNPGLRYLSLAVFIILFPNAFILLVDIIGFQGQDARFVFCIYPLYSICIMWTVHSCLIQYAPQLGLSIQQDQ